MTEVELQHFLQVSFPKETEYCEWKEFKNLKNEFSGKAGTDLVSYVSALANMTGGHLVIGVEDGTLNILGTDTYNYTPDQARLRLKEQCANLPSEGMDISEYITDDTHKKVWVVHVSKHMLRLPVYAHSKAWQRIGDNLVEMTSSRLNTILTETEENEDWSAMVIPDATLDDLDPKAILLAKEKFKELYPSKSEEVDMWDTPTFLNKALLTRKGKITRTTIILLGKPESEHYLNPAVCKIRWILKDGGDENKDFQILSIPMITAVEEFAHLVRNTNYTYTIQGNMFPESMRRYDVFTLREPLCNAIAHQDYTKAARIEVVEYEDEKLIFRNYGQFLPSSVEDIVERDFPESRYRNRALVEAMRNVKMVETEGGGIKKLYVQQKKRFFPMPIYDTCNEMVKCEIRGRVLDENFARILVNNPKLSLTEIILLDKVQKHEPLTDDARMQLKKKGFIEGRKPNFYLSFSVSKDSKHVDMMTSYIKNKGFDDEYFKKLILEYIAKFGAANRNEINNLLMDKLPESLSENQKYNKITNLLAWLKRMNKIIVGKKKKWILVNISINKK